MNEEEILKTQIYKFLKKYHAGFYKDLHVDELLIECFAAGWRQGAKYRKEVI